MEQHIDTQVTTICLNMIVKNESHIIVDTLKNLCSYINFSYWVISDTGSSDNTKQLIIDFFKDKGIPGELVENKWVDFAYNRTKALECAFNKTDYLLVFDADDSIVGNFKLPKVFDCERYLLRFGENFSYVRPLLFTNRKKWRFKGVLHEFLENIDPVSKSETIEGNYHLVSGRSGNRNKNPNKYIDDATVLKNAHFKELDTDYSLACRYAFYCAQSYKDAGEKYENDAIEWYKKCMTLNMWEQEKYHSCLSIGDIYMRQKDYNNALKYWYKTVEYDGDRIEGIVSAVTYLRNDGQHLLVNALYHRFKNYKPFLQNKLFLFQNMYNDNLEYNNMISSYYVNDKQTGYACFKKIVINGKLDYNLLKVAIDNFKYYQDYFKADTNENILELFYAYDNLMTKYNRNIKGNIDSQIITVWNTLFEITRPLLTVYPGLNFIKNDKNDKMCETDEPNKKIMITFTTCKRLDLFKQTINSILNHWTDINKIDYWFCVDDNSLDADRIEMTQLYPWINYYMKPIEEKGHRKSMNIIWDKLHKIKPLYWIHMEDDFLFYHKTNYIETAINGLTQFSQTQSVKQILFNRNYGEIFDHYKISGDVKTSNSNIVIHDHCSNKSDCNYVNCHYWPHFSFRPSLIDAKIVLDLGNFNSANQFFEMDYAKKWTNAGYKSGFFDRITNRHIGRLTKDRSTKMVKNAYDLNNENQFNSSCKSEDDKDKLNIPIKIINLERRFDRKSETIKKMSDAGFSEDKGEYEFVKATDGSALEPTIFIKELFLGNDFGNRKGVIGCALSHYKLWQQLVYNLDDTYYLIMEDDFQLCPNFKTRLLKLAKTGAFINKDALFLGYSMFSKDREKHFNEYNDLSTNETKIVPLNKRLYIGGYFAYSINKNGAKILLDYINKNGIKHGIDYLNKIIPELQSYECQPQLVFSEWNENGAKIDSDIQNIYDKLDFTSVKDEKIDLMGKFTFIPNLDILGNDIYFYKKPLKELLQIAYNDPKCLAFNTLGFFKNKADLTELKSSPYFKEGDGVYMKNKVYNNDINKKETEIKTIKIKMLCNWTSSKILCKEWSNMCETGYKWKNYELVFDNTNEKTNNVDYYVIVNSVSNNEYYDPKRTIVFQMEPWVNDLSKSWGVKTWGNWAEPDPEKFLAVRGRKSNCHNNAFWQLELTLNDLYKPELFEKTKDTIISSICSSKYYDEGHIDRIDFLKFLEAKGDVELDIWNQDNKHSFKNYRGHVSPYIDKSKGLTNYKYYFMMENNYETNFITEKLWEPILCETLVFYYGCPNVADYIDPGAFVLLDITDFEKSYQIIKQALKEDWWPQRIDIIRKEKRKILGELAFFPTIDKIISQNIKDQEQTIYKRDYEKYFSEFIYYDKKSKNKTNNYCFIHSCHLKEKGLNILNDTINIIIETNAYKHFDKIFIVNIGLKIDLTDLLQYKLEPEIKKAILDKIRIINYSENPLLFEIPTINLIRTFCEYNSNCKILYLHTKGISFPHNQNITDWRNMMLYFLVNKDDTCLELLKNYDTVGCNYMDTPCKHYSGNFWWATSDYIKLLSKIPDGSVRHASEWWLLSNNSVKSYEIHGSKINHYHTAYPFERYVTSNTL